MKKKVVSILSVLMFALMCLTFSGCGDKYEDFQFDITYAFKSDAEQWMSGNDGIDIKYGDKGSDSYSKIFDDEGNGKIYIKVDVKNVKSKYLDSIAVDSVGVSSINFVSTDIAVGGVFAIDISFEDVAQTNLRFYESNSQKSKTISLDVSRELTYLAIKETSSAVNYAVSVGDFLNLKQMNNIDFTPGSNQKGVNYRIAGIGRIAGGAFDLVAESNDYLKIEGDVLRVDYGYTLTSNNYVVDVEAISTSHNIDGDYISVHFYIYITENYKIGANTYSPVITKGEGAGISTVENLILYPNDTSNKHLSVNPTLYNNQTVKLDYSALKENSIYSKSEVYSFNGIVQYKIEVLVDNNLYDFDNQNEGINGLIITNEGDRFNLLAINADVPVNNVKFRVVLDNVDYGYSNVKPIYEKSFTVNKQLFVEKIVVNDNEDETSACVYNTDVNNYKGLQLKVDALPFVAGNNCAIKLICAQDKLIVDGAGDGVIDGVNVVYMFVSGTTITVNFAEGVASEQKLYFVVEQGVADIASCTFEFIVEKKVTASYLQLFANDPTELELETSKYILKEDVANVNDLTMFGNSKEETPLYIKVLYIGSDLVENTITINSSNTQIKFDNGNAFIALDSSKRYHFNNSLTEIYNGKEYKCAIYKVGVNKASAGQESTLTIKAGDVENNIVVTTSATKIKYVNVADVSESRQQNFVIKTTTIDAIKFENGTGNYRVNNSSQNFAISIARVADFVVSGYDVDGKLTKDVIYKTKIDKVDENRPNFNMFATYLPAGEVVNTFTLNPRNVATQVLNIRFGIYVKEDDNSISYNDCSNDSVIRMEVAVYQPLTGISLDSVDKNSLVYVNSKITEATTAHIVLSTNSNASEKLYFTGDNEIKIYSLGISATPEDGTISMNMDGVSQLTDLTPSQFSGKTLSVSLTKAPTDVTRANFVVTVNKFGVLTSVQKDFFINFGNYNPISNIELIGIENKADGTNYLDLSFMRGEMDSKSFKAKVYYKDLEGDRFDDLDYKLYRYEQNSDGTPILTSKVDVTGLIGVDFKKSSEKYVYDVTLTANKANGAVGGYYRLVVSAQDSYNDLTGQYYTTCELNLRVADGSLKNKYQISSVADFAYINNDLKANYVLTQNIDLTKQQFVPIGYKNGIVSAFDGLISGRDYYLDANNKVVSQKYVIRVNLKDAVVDGNMYLGLFAEIGSSGSVKDLMVYATVDAKELSFNIESKQVYIGAVAGVNNGVIENVSVNFSNSQIELTENIKKTINFGGVVGQNNGKVDLVSGKVVMSGNFASEAQVDHNIAGVAGVNTGIIVGKFKDKASFAAIDCDVVVDLSLVLTRNNNNVVVEVAGVAAESANGTISNLLITGKMSVGFVECVANLTKGWIGGIVADANNGNINTCSAFAVDIESINSNVNIGGIAGKTNNTTISLTRVISVESNGTKGKISGTGKVAGIVVYATNGSIKNSSVENFVIQNGFYTLNSSSSKVAGLVVEQDGATISNCFVSADINGAEKILLANNTDKSYFIGNVGNDFEISYPTLKITYKNSTLSVNGTEPTNIQSEINARVNDVLTWGKQEDYNVVNLDGEDYYLPYLLLKDETNKTYPQQILQPTDIELNINDDYLNITHSHAVKEETIEMYGCPVNKVLMVNYYENAGDLINTYYLAVDIKDLLTQDLRLFDLSVVPAQSDGGVAYQIVQGSVYASVLGNQITFKKDSGSSPIIVKCYSAFNKDVCAYVAIYAKPCLSDFIVKADNLQIVAGDGVNYQLSTYLGAENILIKLDAENKNSLNGVAYTSILKSSFAKNLVIDCEYDDTYLKVSKSGSELGSYALTTVGSFTEANKKCNLKFVLKLNLTDMDKDAYPCISGKDQMLELASKTVEVIINQAASAVDIVGANPVTVPSEWNVQFAVELHSGYQDKDYPVQAQGVKVALDKVNNYVYFVEEYVTDGGEVVDYNKDKIFMKFVVEDGQDEINRIITAVNATITKESEKIYSPLELFDFNIDCVRKTYGYRYSISMQLKADTAYRLLQDTIKFKIIAVAQSNADIQDEFILYIRPTDVSMVDFENYQATSAEAYNVYTNLITSNSMDTSVISPGGYGGIMKLFITPTYANVVDAVVTSTYITVPGMGTVRLHFEQLVYDEVNNEYLTLTPANEVYEGVNKDGKPVGGVHLKLVSKLAGGQSVYNGVVYVHVMLDKFVGYSDNIKVELKVKTNNDVEKSCTRTFLTQYLPGATIIYNGEKVGQDTYVIQEKSANNVVSVKIYGYQFQSTPDPVFKWVNEAETKNIADYVTYYWLNDYDKLKQNNDGSYTMDLRLSIAENLPCGFTLGAKMSLATEDRIITSTDESTKTLTFYPVKHLLSSLTLDNMASGNILNLAQDRTNKFTLLFETNKTSFNNSDEIYENLVKGLTGVGELFEAFKYADNKNETFATSNAYYSFNIEKDKTITISALGVYTRDITITLFYKYDEDDGYKLKFSTKNTDGFNNMVDCTFTLNIYKSTTRENAHPLTNSNVVIGANNVSTLNLEAGTDYILTEDIYLENFMPTDAVMASIDGNGYRFIIKSFALGNSLEKFGLFSTLSTYEDGNGNIQKSLLYNVIVDYGQLNSAIAVGEDVASVVFGGMVAENNGGLIYNSDVMNCNTSNKTIKFIPANNAGVKVVFGGFVGINSGVITNSRVGTNAYYEIKDTATIPHKERGTLTFIVGNPEGSLGQAFVATAGGFAGQNSGTISSSYIANSNLINYSASVENSRTAGFVAENLSTGAIMYSYVTGKESTLTASNAYAGGVSIESTSNGRVAGFVHQNAGVITNSYANIPLKSDASFLSGFVYNNQSSARIQACYAACTFNGKRICEGTNDSDQPFVAYENNVLLSYGQIINCYYLIGTVESTANIAESLEDNKQATKLNIENFRNSDNLIDFVFVLSNSQAEREQGVWSYVNNRLLPEIVNTNNVTHSYRYLQSFENGTFKYSNPADYVEGSLSNPFIITSVDDFNTVFASGTSDEKAFVGSVRIINDIDFANDKTAIKTRRKFTLGSSNSTLITSVEGNGLTISGIYLDVGDSVEESIGLFANVKNAYIKNLNLKFHNQVFSSKNVTYSGGLAGKIENSVVANISLDGSATTITGYNYVGGLAGVITGSSLIYGISSNLSVSAIHSSSEVYSSNSTNIKDMSYAGGIAGVIDLTQRAKTEYNLSYVYVDAGGSFNVSASYAGGVAGYIGKQSSSLRVKFYTGSTASINGDYAAGGLYAICFGSVRASQVTAVETTQFDYDDNIAEYIISLENGTTTSVDSLDVGNKTLITSSKYAGGLIGLAVGAEISECYSKASFYVGTNEATDTLRTLTIGGLVAGSVGSIIAYSYAIPYINFEGNANYLKEVGGLVGVAYGKQSSNDYINSIALMLDDGELGITYLSYTFSTIISDYVKLNNLKTSSAGDEIDLDYICGDYILRSTLDGKAGSLIYTYAGIISKYGSMVGKRLSTDVREINLVELLNYKDDPSTQYAVFNAVFASWIDDFWNFNSRRYYPLLLNNNVDNFYEIREADDFKVLLNNPTGSYRIMNDIDMSEWCAANKSNWVFNVKFTGTLIAKAEREEDLTPKLYNVHVNTITNDTAGLFKETSGADIRDVQVVWKNNAQENKRGINVAGNLKVGDVGGFSCRDTNSSFLNIIVMVASDADNEKFDGSLVTTSNGTVAGIGGIVANAVNTNLANCSFIGNIGAEDNAVKVYSENNDINIGAIIGHGKCVVENAEEDTEVVEASSIMDCKTGNDDYILNVYIDSINTEGEVAIGLLVGRCENVAISSISSGKSVEKISYLVINGDINAKNLFLGGAVGWANSSNISEIELFANIITKATIKANSVEIGNLIGEFSTNGHAVQDCNVFVNTQIESHIEGLLNLAGGIARVKANPTIKRSLFSGSIKQTDTCAVEAMWAGGVVGYVDELTNLSICETMSTVDMEIGTGATYKLIAGGLIAGSDLGETDGTVLQSNLKLENCVTSGKLLLTTKDYAENQCLYVGGIVGIINEIVAENVVSTTSIIADCIGNSAIQDINFGALFGKLGKECEQLLASTDETVYYSTDIALFPEDSCIGYNLTAGNLYNALTIDNGAWLEKKGNGIQVLANLKRFLLKNKIINAEDTFLLGSSLNPYSTYYDYVIDTSESKLDYAYCFLDMSTESNQDESNLANKLSFKGFLLGLDADNEYEFYLNIGISKHSVLSNIHIKLEDVEVVSNGGILVSNNSGVVYNCSVSGYGIEANSTSGIIANENNGLIAYCYSTAEVNSSNICGITNVNNGKLLTNYFTGIINNTGTSAGILSNSSIDSYAYNNYSAGVINNIAEKSNGLVAMVDAFNGSNNYLDLLANVETIEKEEGSSQDIDKFTGVKTYNLMSNLNGNQKLLKGNWYTTATNGSISLATTTFGYNYCYPVYQFNKHYYDVGNEKFVVYPDYLNHQQYTGVGGTIATGVGGEQTLDDGNIVLAWENNGNNDIWYEGALNKVAVNDFFKVPHLGVLSAIQGLVNNNNVTLNYMLVHDIDIKNSPWIAIGTRRNENLVENLGGFVLSSDYSFGGVFVSDAGFGLSEDLETWDPLTSENVCEISNLTNNGLFEIGADAYIAAIKFTTAVGLKATGLLGTNIFATAKVTVQNIDISKTTISGEFIGGLFGDVLGCLSVQNLITSDETLIDVSGANSYAGLFAYAISGKLVVLPNKKKGSSQASQAKYQVAFNGEGALVGGVAGEIADGSVVTYVAEGSQKLELNIGSNGVNSLGGIAAVIKGGDISNISIKPSIKTIKINNIYGGVAAKMLDGVTTITNVDLLNPSSDGFIIDGLQVFGLLLGEAGTCANEDGSGLKAGTLVCNGVELNGLKINIKVASLNQAIQGYGVLIGRYTGGTIIGNSKFIKNGEEIDTNEGLESLDVSNAKLVVKSVSLIVNGGANIGGIVGYCSNYVAPDDAHMFGMLGQISYNYVGGLVVTGTSNVGGVIGSLQIQSLISNISDTFGDLLEKEIGSIETVDLETKDNSNWGGLFGLVEGDFKESLTNNNTVNIATMQIKESKVVKIDDATVSNLGGVAGKFVNTDYNVQDTVGEEDEYTLANLADITTDYFTGKDGDVDIFTNLNNERDLQVSLLSVNVGGVFGLYIYEDKDVESRQQHVILKFKNEAEIHGYQNVGGIIGYAKGINIIADEEGVIEQEGNVLGAKNVGGVFGYLGESTIGPKVKIEIVDPDAPTEPEEPEDLYEDFITSSGSVYGNVNVGGFVGYLQYCDVSNTKIGENGTNVVVKGIYFRELTKKLPNINAEEQEEDVSTYYIPTNIGGFVGAFDNDNGVKNLTVAGIKVFVNVISAKEGVALEDEDNKNSQAISTVKNSMAQVNMQKSNGASEINSIITSSGYVDYNGTTTVFATEQSGWGGLIGGTYQSAILKSDEDKTSKVSVAEMDVNVNASLGINVGTFIGYVFITTSVNISQVVANMAPASIGENTSVSGAYFVGGLIGFIDSGNTGSVEISCVYANSTKINVQTEDVGMYVGGLFGRVNCTAKDLQLRSGVNIVTDNSHYIGGLIGWLDGNLIQSGEYNTSSPQATGNYVAEEDVITGSDCANFGAFVGLLKVTGKHESDETAVTVEGYHEYPFTVFAIENENYYDAGSIFTVDDEADLSTTYLEAQAYYINRDYFKISGSSKTFDGNPLINGNKEGWSKQYTGFKQIQRFIPQDIASGNSRAVIYDAACIKAVGTIGKLGLSNTWLYGPNTDDLDIWKDVVEEDGALIELVDEDYKPTSYYWKKKVVNGQSLYIYNPDYICFTIYDEEVADVLPTLYSAIGMASPVSEEVKDVEDYAYYLDLKSSNNGYQGLTYFNFGEMDDDEYVWKTYTTVGDSEGTKYTASYQAPENQERVLYYKYKDVEYLFQTVFENASCNGLSSETPEGNTITITKASDDQLPGSGSILECCGFVSSEMDKASQGVKAETDVGQLILGILEAIAAVAFVALVTWVSKGMLTGVALKLVAGKVFTLLVMGAIVSSSLLNNAIYAFANVNQLVSTKFNFYGQRDINMGYLSGAKYTSLYYQNGKFLPESDKVVMNTNNGQPYFKYTANGKPNDFYEKNRICYKYELNDDDRVELQETLIYMTYDNYIKEKKEGNIGSSNFIYEGDSDGKKYSLEHITMEGNKYIVYENYWWNNNTAEWCVHKGSMSDLKYARCQYINDSSVKDLDVELKYEVDSEWYIYGKYENGGYKYVSQEGNLIEYKNNKYTLNGGGISDEDLVEKTVPLNFKPVQGNPLSDWKKGYHYLDGAYYSVNGKSGIVKDGTNLERYAKYKLTNKAENGVTTIARNVPRSTPIYTQNNNGDYYKIGSNYYPIRSEFIDGTGDEPGYWQYTVNGEITDLIPANRYDMENYISGTWTIESIQINNPGNYGYAIKDGSDYYVWLPIYPCGFKNPYLSNIANSKDDITYKRAGEDDTNVITADVVFYYYEGGYLYEKGYFETDKKIYIRTDIYNDDTIGSETDDSVTKTKNGKTYTIVNNVTVKIQEIESGYTYVLAGDNQCLCIGTPESQGEDLFLNHYEIDTRSNYGYDISNYNANKYELNKKYGLYSYYKYMNGSAVYGGDNSVWIKKSGVDDKEGTQYYIVPEEDDFTGTLNGKPTTKLFERVKVTLGGNKQLKHLKTTGTTTSGKITIV